MTIASDDIMNLRIGDICAVVSQLHPINNRQYMTDHIDLVRMVLKTTGMSSEMLFIAIIYLWWQTGNDMLEEHPDLMAFLKRQARGHEPKKC